MMAACDRYREIMTAVLDGVADDGERSDFEEHIKGCEDCNRLYHELAWMQKETQKLSADPPVDLKEIILQRVNEQTQEEHILHLRRRRTMRNAIVSVAAAAAILIAAFAGGYDLVMDYFPGRDAAVKGTAESDIEMFIYQDGSESEEFAELEDYDMNDMASTNGLADNEIMESMGETESEDSMAADTVLSHDEIMREVKSAFLNMSITGFTREVIYMSASRYPGGITGEAVPGIPDIRLYTVEDYPAFSERIADVLTGSYYELTAEEISELGLYIGGSKIMVLVGLDS